jgi:hypothetical protein
VAEDRNGYTYFFLTGKPMRILILLSLFALTTPAWAYLDPGTGSMLLQVILGGIAAVGVAIKLGWHKIRAALGFGKKPDAKEDQEQEAG